MTVVRETQAGLGAVFEAAGDRDLPAHYGRPETAHRAARKVVGVTEMAYGVVELRGEDRVEYLDNVVSNRVPATDGAGCYALLLDPQGRVEADLYVYNAGERLLVFAPPSVAGDVAAEWREKTFIQDVEVEVATDRFGVFGVHGPKATEKVASVLNGASAPGEALTFVRGTVRDAGVTVVRTDAPAGEEGFEVVCAADAAPGVFDALLNHGLNAAPFGRRTWETLTLEAGTPLFDPDLRGRLPNALGLRNAVDFEKGCFVGQEVVSRVENRGDPGQRLVGLRLGADAPVPESGAAVLDDEASVGEVTRAADCPGLEGVAALALLDAEAASDRTGEGDGLAVRVDGDAVGGSLVDLPFVEGSERSARLPAY